MIDISVVIPTYNSEKLIEQRIRNFQSVLQATKWSWEIIVCDDGSKDRSVEIAQHLAKEIPECRVIPSARNRGRGKNVADGFIQCQGRMIGFADADSSTSTAYVVPAILALESGYDIAEANRGYKIELAELPFIFHRILSHSVYAKLVHWFLGIEGHDTETGFKFFKKETTAQLLAETKSEGWFWDTEVIANAHEQGLRVAEIPSSFIRTKSMGSTVNYLRDSWTHFKSLLMFAWKKRAIKLKRECCSNPRQTEPLR